MFQTPCFFCFFKRLWLSLMCVFCADTPGLQSLKSIGGKEQVVRVKDTRFTNEEAATEDAGAGADDGDAAEARAAGDGGAGATTEAQTQEHAPPSSPALSGSASTSKKGVSFTPSVVGGSSPSKAG